MEGGRISDKKGTQTSKTKNKYTVFFSRPSTFLAEELPERPATHTAASPASLVVQDPAGS